MTDLNVEEPLMTNVRPATDAILTVRIVKSLSYRSIKNHILKSVNLKETTPKQLLEEMKDIINTTGAYRPYRNVEYDAIKIYTKAHGSKSMNLAINLDNDDWVILNKDIPGDEKTLWDLDIRNETEISIFNWADYLAFKANPEEKW